MSRISRIVLGVVLGLAFALAAVVIDAMRPREDLAARRLARLTGLPAPALAVSYRQPRCRLVLDDAAATQPGFPAPRTMDFVHGR